MMASRVASEACREPAVGCKHWHSASASSGALQSGVRVTTHSMCEACVIPTRVQHMCSCGPFHGGYRGYLCYQEKGFEKEPCHWR